MASTTTKKKATSAKLGHPLTAAQRAAIVAALKKAASVARGSHPKKPHQGQGAV